MWPACSASPSQPRLTRPLAAWVEVNGDEPPPAPLGGASGDQFVPHEDGYPITLKDGISSRLRFRKDPSEPTGFQAEWRVANRSFPIPEGFTLGPAVARVTTYFHEPHMTLEFDDEARAFHLSYQGGLNVQSHVSREKGDTQTAARLGAAPWHIGVLAALLLVYEIFCGVHRNEALEGRSLKVTKDHLQRAFLLLKLAGGLTSRNVSPQIIYVDISVKQSSARVSLRCTDWKTLHWGTWHPTPMQSPPLRKSSSEVCPHLGRVKILHLSQQHSLRHKMTMVLQITMLPLHLTSPTVSWPRRPRQQ